MPSRSHRPSNTCLKSPANRSGPGKERRIWSADRRKTISETKYEEPTLSTCFVRLILINARKDAVDSDASRSVPDNPFQRSSGSVLRSGRSPCGCLVRAGVILPGLRGRPAQPARSRTDAEVVISLRLRRVTGRNSSREKKHAIAALARAARSGRALVRIPCSRAPRRSGAVFAQRRSRRAAADY